ncbi:hypothetical protein B5G34_00625 [Flavonifractor sp. An82]|uniref:ClpP family protease n=1 Tax=Flavonifractor sp. An82 TaxID=1965660 RepID=UPI000B3A8B53|nr:ATP-dependent Clp protease proteolytic subunit [Flavonifractor sp. An82]OUN23638.1 hypothetical protein B5G34_00625 [Flavonifractor sp. An82]
MDTFEIQIPAGSGANKQLPDPYLLNYYESVDNRILWIDSAVSEDTIEIAKKIVRWNAEDDDASIPIENRMPIKLYIASGGGDAYAMLVVLDAILSSQTPVYTVNMGLAASAACVLLIAGHKRFAMPHSHALWHSGSGGLSGTMEQLQSATKHFDTMDAQLQDLFLSKTKIDLKTYKKQKDKDWYFTADQMLDGGLVDVIVSSVNEIL